MDPLDASARKLTQDKGRAFWGLLLVVLCAGCNDAARVPEDWRWLEIPLSGHPDVIEHFTGQWADEFWIQVVIQRDRLAILGPPNIAWLDARTVGDEIHFSSRQGSRSSERVLRLTEHGGLTFADPESEPGQIYCGTCHPVLKRYSFRDFQLKRLFRFTEQAKQTLDDQYKDLSYRALDWLANLT